MKPFKRPFRVTEAVVRGVAVQVFILSLLSLITNNLIPVLLLAADFLIRVFLIPRFSPLVAVSRYLIYPLGLFRKKMINFKPKRFAAGIGLSLSLLSLVMYLSAYQFAFRIIISMITVFSFLEAFFKVCAGCKIFSLLIKTGILNEDICTDCYFQNGEGI